MACICQRHVTLPSSSRSFSTSLQRVVSIHQRSNLPDDVTDSIPAYPYPTHLYSQGQRGLYGGSRIQFGNTTGEKNMPRVRRTWSLNVKRKRLYSEALDRTIQLQVTTRVLRTIHKYGGLDEYLLGEKPARIKALGETGWWLRWAIMQTDTVKARFAEEKEKLLSSFAQAQSIAQPRSTEQAQETMESVEPGVNSTLEFSTTPIVEDNPANDLEPEHTESLEKVIPLRRRFRRITFRVDRGKMVSFDGKNWIVRRGSAQRAAWERDVAKVAKLQRRRKPSEEELSPLESAADYVQDSLWNKKLQRGMPPSFVVHRQWLKRNARQINTRSGIRGRSLASPARALLLQSLRFTNQRLIARAIDRRSKAKAFKR